MRIGITGARGFLGWHVRCSLKTSGEHDVIPAARETFSSRDQLDRFVKRCDAIVHAAGVNRPLDDRLERANVSLADQLVDALERTGAQPAVAFANSTQVDGESAYGRGKRAAAERLAAWASKRGASFSNVVLPNLFGEGGRPCYNSVVATFAWQVANGAAPTVEVDTSIELLHAQDAARAIVDALEDSAGGVQEHRPGGERVTVSELKETLEDLADSYVGRGTIPEFPSPLRLRLFNAMRWHLPAEHWPQRLTAHTDERGSFYEAVRADNGGQTSMSTTKPCVTRGNHFHFDKVERFVVLSGEAVIRWRQLCNPDVQEFRLSGSEPAFIDMPTLHAHDITNVGGGELITLLWAHEHFDPERPDTVPEPVDPPSA